MGDDFRGIGSGGELWRLADLQLVQNFRNLLRVRQLQPMDSHLAADCDSEISSVGDDRIDVGTQVGSTVAAHDGLPWDYASAGRADFSSNNPHSSLPCGHPKESLLSFLIDSRAEPYIISAAGKSSRNYNIFIFTELPFVHLFSALLKTGERVGRPRVY